LKFTLSIEDKHGGIADEYSFDEGEFLVGRSHSADIILPSDNVSRRHARLYTIDGRCYIEDLGSANGVFLNGRRIHEVMEIEGTAQIRVGDYYLHVRSDEAPQPEDKVHCRIRGLDHGVADQVFPIKRTVNLVGRGKDCTVTIIDPSVSRIHAKLTVERSGAITLEDLKSSNGTFVNDEKIEVATLNHRDRLRIGNVELMVEFPDLAPGDGQDEESNEGLAHAWTQNDGRSGQKIMLGVIAGVVILGGLVLVLFGDRIFGSSESATSGADAAEVKPAPDAEGPGGATQAPVTDVALLEREGRTQIKGRSWDQAVVTWRKILDIDPLHTDARKALNQISIWKRDHETLEKARTAGKEKRYGEAARLLRNINDLASVYLNDAKEELDRLREMKPALVVQAEALFKSKDCKGALKLYEQARELDPDDGDLAARIKAVKKKGSKCR
jgi:pSer/pThr/pTyr-binding forkhead associated (FHA) protein